MPEEITITELEFVLQGPVAGAARFPPRKTMDRVRIIFPRQNYCIIARPQSHHVDFEIYDLHSVTEGEPFFKLAADANVGVPESDLGKAEVFISGEVKWDGCSNWEVVDKETRMHFCDREGPAFVGWMMQFCWDMTSRLCPNWFSALPQIEWEPENAILDF